VRGFVPIQALWTIIGEITQCCAANMTISSTKRCRCLSLKSTFSSEICEAHESTAGLYWKSAHGEQKFEVMSCPGTIQMDPTMEAIMPILLWLLGVPIVVVVALMLTHVI
jgi:hypothetical protein